MSLLLALLAAQDVLRPEDQPKRMLYRYLEAECRPHFEARRKALEAVKTPFDVRTRQEALRAIFLGALDGLPEKTPLNPQVTGTLVRDGYRVEKVIYESLPGHHVTANLYIPAGPGPFPGVLFPVGHYGNPKAADEYQRACILLAKNGLAALTFDPIGQGERYQTMGPTGRPIAQGTSEHTLLDVGLLLVGSCAARHFIWDGIRGLDYLAGRPEIDPKRLGCFGHSGGGTQTSYLMALDDRVQCAIPSCFTTTIEKLYATVGPQDGESCIPGQVASGFGHADFSILRAPRPTQLNTPARDYYDIEGAWDTFRQAKRIYGILGHSERMDLFETDAPHSISKPGREASVRWMRRWLLAIDDAPVETDFPIEKDADLQCTKSGLLLRDFKEKTAYEFTADRARELDATRAKLPIPKLLDEVRRLIAVGTPPKAKWEVNAFLTDPGIKVPALFFEPRKKALPILFVNGDGKSKGVQEWSDTGHGVTAIDLRGMGETEPDPPHRGLVHFVKADWKEAYIAMSLGRPLLGQRVRDILAIVSGACHLVGVGSAAPVALHAAALDPRIQAVTLDGMVISWSAVAKTAVTYNQLTNVVPGALKVYDLPDLAAAIAPRTVTIRNPVDAAGE
ncbi:MAG TPA: acetylxylan esterase, partial [Planctomycetota bacterium]|nr:acetylxylan esterase [Planctomycetota bacterium]